MPKMSEQVQYLLSFLAVLVERAGGEIVIENLSRHSGSKLQLRMTLDKAGDKVTLTTKSEKVA